MSLTVKFDAEIHRFLFFTTFSHEICLMMVQMSRNMQQHIVVKHCNWSVVSDVRSLYFNIYINTYKHTYIHTYIHRTADVTTITCVCACVRACSLARSITSEWNNSASVPTHTHTQLDILITCHSEVTYARWSTVTLLQPCDTHIAAWRPSKLKYISFVWPLLSR
jgi:hypothetical protein